MATKRASGNKNKKPSGIKVDFSDTESQGVVDEGDYVIEVTEVEQKTSDNSGADYLAWEFKIDGGDFDGRKLFHNTSLQPQALFNLRGLLEALGTEVPQGVMEFDPADMIGEKCGCTVAHEKYEGKTKARPVEFFDADDVDADGDDKKETKAKPKDKEKEPETKSKKKAKAKEPEFKVDDKVTFEDDDGNEQSGVITEIDGDDYTVTVGKGKKAEEWTLEASDLTAVE